MAGMGFWMGFGGGVARNEGQRKRDATKQRLHVEEMHSEDDFELLDGVLEGAVARAGGQGKRNTTNIDYTPTKCNWRAVFNEKTGGSEHAHVRILLFYIQKGCRHAFCRGEIAPKICQYAAAKKCQKLVGFC